MAPGAAVSIHGLGIEPLTRFWNMRGSDDPTPGVSLRSRFHGRSTLLLRRDPLDSPWQSDGSDVSGGLGRSDGC